MEGIEAAIEAAMAEDDRKGATGEWVGVLGFSQGATVAGSLLLRQQGRADSRRKGSGRLAGVRFRFGILIAGSAPLVSLEPERGFRPRLGDAAQLSRTSVPPWEGRRGEHVLRLPTMHIHGTRDPGLERHRQLLEQYCEEGSTRLVEWDGHHKVPIKKTDVAAVVEQVLHVAREVGLLSNQ